MFIHCWNDEYYVVGARYDHNDYIYRSATPYDETRWITVLHQRLIEHPYWNFGPFTSLNAAIACLAENNHLSVEQI